MTGRLATGEVGRARQGTLRCPAWNGPGPPFAPRGRGSSRLGFVEPSSQGITCWPWRRLFVRLSVGDLSFWNPEVAMNVLSKLRVAFVSLALAGGGPPVLLGSARRG